MMLFFVGPLESFVHRNLRLFCLDSAVECSSKSVKKEVEKLTLYRTYSNEDEFYDNWYNNNFWMEFLEGDHLSYDLIILNGKIQFHVCFIGYKDEDNLGEFKYWESIKKKPLPKIIKKLIVMTIKLEHKIF